MKKRIWSIVALLVFGFVNAQERSDYSKGYIGVSIGASFPGGDLTSNGFKAGTGLNLSLINGVIVLLKTLGLRLIGEHLHLKILILIMLLMELVI